MSSTFGSLRRSVAGWVARWRGNQGACKPQALRVYSSPPTQEPYPAHDKLTNLPTELLLEILEFLSQEDIESLHKVNRRLKSVVDPIVYRTFRFGVRPPRFVAIPNAGIPRIGDSIQYQPRPDPAASRVDALLQTKYVPSTMHCARELVISVYRLWNDPHMGPQNTMCGNLDDCGCRGNREQSEWRKCVKKLAGHYLPEMMARMPNLTTVRLNAMPAVDSALFVETLMYLNTAICRLCTERGSINLHVATRWLFLPRISKSTMQDFIRSLSDVSSLSLSLNCEADFRPTFEAEIKELVGRSPKLRVTDQSVRDAIRLGGGSHSADVLVHRVNLEYMV